MLNELELETDLGKTELLVALKKEARQISLQDIMDASIFIIEDAQYVQKSYRDRFVASYMQGFIIRITDLKNDQGPYHGPVNMEELSDALELLKKQKKENDENENFNRSFFLIYMIISMYTTFVLDEPIHPMGTPFPGGFEVSHDGENYLCPVKESQKDNPGAVCGFCIAEQDQNI